MQWIAGCHCRLSWDNTNCTGWTTHLPTQFTGKIHLSAFRDDRVYKTNQQSKIQLHKGLRIKTCIVLTYVWHVKCDRAAVSRNWNQKSILRGTFPDVVGKECCLEEEHWVHIYSEVKSTAQLTVLPSNAQREQDFAGQRNSFCTVHLVVISVMLPFWYSWQVLKACNSVFFLFQLFW